MWASVWACEQLRKARKYSIVRSVKPAVPPVEFSSNGYGNPQGRASVGSNGLRQTAAWRDGQARTVAEPTRGNLRVSLPRFLDQEPLIAAVAAEVVKGVLVRRLDPVLKL